ncbi:MAG: hypothetical protein ABI699_17410 [Caldimonas sp.]
MLIEGFDAMPMTPDLHVYFVSLLGRGRRGASGRGLRVLAHEMVHRVVLSQHIACRHLALTLGHHPVQDANRLAAEPVRPARDVASRVNAGNTCRHVMGDHLPRETLAG